MGTLGSKGSSFSAKRRSYIPKSSRLRRQCVFSIHLGVHLFYLGGSILIPEDYLEDRFCCRRRVRS
jgi:hypothetical protein